MTPDILVTTEELLTSGLRLLWIQDGPHKSSSFTAVRIFVQQFLAASLHVNVVFISLFAVTHK